MVHGEERTHRENEGAFDTSNVTDMAGMFADAHAFNQPLGAAFDTSNVTGTNRMFTDARVFNQPLGAAFAAFDTSPVANMIRMIDGAHAFAEWDRACADRLRRTDPTLADGLGPPTRFDRSRRRWSECLGQFEAVLLVERVDAVEHSAHIRRTRHPRRRSAAAPEHKAEHARPAYPPGARSASRMWPRQIVRTRRAFR